MQQEIEEQIQSNVVIGNRYFDTFFATIETFENGRAVSIDRHCHCCGKIENLQRYISTQPAVIYYRAKTVTSEMNLFSISTFLRFKKRSVALYEVFRHAANNNYILTKDRFIQQMNEANINAFNPSHHFTRLRSMSPERFIACCKILNKYGILIQTNDEKFVALHWELGCVSEKNVRL